MKAASLSGDVRIPPIRTLLVRAGHLEKLARSVAGFVFVLDRYCAAAAAGQIELHD